MKLKIGLSLGLLILLSASLTAFQKITKADLRAQKLEDRLENYARVSREKCLEGIYEDAAAIVDSLMIERARSKRDTVGKPPKPLRPDKPEIRPPNDSMSVKPLVDLPIDSTQ
ncbi:MAG: hypothetical protein KDC34_05315 [Saprospiraceae bacterium]|nr:hypothetical protein [Saprospiraceae bacterium]